jgi:hypothetical protein
MPNRINSTGSFIFQGGLTSRTCPIPHGRPTSGQPWTSRATPIPDRACYCPRGRYHGRSLLRTRCARRSEKRAPARIHRPAWAGNRLPEMAMQISRAKYTTGLLTLHGNLFIKYSIFNFLPVRTSVQDTAHRLWPFE